MKTPIWMYLALKEMWRNRGRFFLVSLVIALITLLVVFLAGLAEGLGSGNKEFLSKLDGELVVFQEQANLSLISSQLSNITKRKIRRVPGVAELGAVGFSSVYITDAGNQWEEAVSMFGVEPGEPGEPAAVAGRPLSGSRAKEVIIGRNVALRTGLDAGEELVVKSTKAGEEELHTLEIVAITDGQQYFIQPSIFVPIQTWDRIRPSAVLNNSQDNLTYNIINVKLADPAAEATVANNILEEVRHIEVADRQTAYEAAPGYREQQSTINTQRGFTLLIGILVVGGFFQIQTLQKVGQVGMLKALGAPNRLIGLATSTQIVLTNILGVLIGATATLILAMTLPPTIPIVFVGQQVVVALIVLLIIGPVGGLVSIRYLTRVEPLTALGLSS